MKISIGFVFSTFSTACSVQILEEKAPGYTQGSGQGPKAARALEPLDNTLRHRVGLLDVLDRPRGWTG